LVPAALELRATTLENWQTQLDALLADKAARDEAQSNLTALDLALDALLDTVSEAQTSVRASIAAKATADLLAAQRQSTMALADIEALQLRRQTFVETLSVLRTDDVEDAIALLRENIDVMSSLSEDELVTEHLLQAEHRRASDEAIISARLHREFVAEQQRNKWGYSRRDATERENEVLAAAIEREVRVTTTAEPVIRHDGRLAELIDPGEGSISAGQFIQPGPKV
jgi:hypothetical protein